MDCSTILERKLEEINESNEFYSFVSSGSVHKNIYLHTHAYKRIRSQSTGKIHCIGKIESPMWLFQDENGNANIDEDEDESIE